MRAQARRRGWELRKHYGRDHVEVWDPTDDELPVVAGSVKLVHTWFAQRALPSGPPPTAVPQSWRPWIDRWQAELNAGRRTPETIRTRRSHLATFARAVGVGPGDVTRDDLVAYVGRTDRAARTAHSIRASLRDFFAFAAAQGVRPDDPAATLPPMRQARSRPRPCPDDAARHALDVADERVALAVRILIEAGLRRAEVTRLRPTDVIGEPGDHALHIVGKAGHERIVPITDDLAQQLRRVRGQWVIESRFGGPVTPRYLGRLVATALPDGWTAHTLRHRFATRAYRATSDIRAVQELLGHASPATTAAYTAVGDDAMRRAAAAAILAP